MSEKPSVDAWQVQVLRLTAFPVAELPIEENSWWIDLVKEPPETRTIRLRYASLREEGSYAGGKLSLKVDPQRVDWLLEPIEGTEEDPLPMIGVFPEVLSRFEDLAIRWLKSDSCLPIQRLAFGAVLLQPVKSREAGYRELSQYLPFEVDAENSSDLLYQINRPRDSHVGIEELKINRISKWSVSAMQLLRFSPPRVGAAKLGNFACRLELDINTAAEFQGELSHKKLADIFRELVKLGEEIAAEGDIQ